MWKLNHCLLFFLRVFRFFTGMTSVPESDLVISKDGVSSFFVGVIWPSSDWLTVGGLEAFTHGGRDGRKPLE